MTINVLLFHLYTIVLHEYTGQDDITVGSLVAGRRHADVEPLIGMFTNFLPKIGRLWLAGIDIDWTGYYAHERRRRIELPTYPMER